VRVRGGGAATDVDYRLSVGVSCGSDVVCPVDDGDEDNDDVNSASSVDRGVGRDGAVCGADADFFTLPVDPACMADVNATFVHARGDIDLQLINRQTGATVASSAGTGNTERIRRLVDPAAVVGRVFL